MAEAISHDTYLDRVKLKQGSKFNLGKINYINSRTRVNVICKKCSYEWETLPKVLYTKDVSCPACVGRQASSAYSEGAMTLYFIKIRTDLIEDNEPEFIYKVGITKTNVQQRFDITDLRRIETLKEIRIDSGKECYEYEQRIHNLLQEWRYFGKFKLSSNGHTECYKVNPLAILKRVLV